MAIEGPGPGSAQVLQDPSNASNLRRGGGRGFILVSCATSVNVNKDTDREIENNVQVFTEHNAICRFRGIWPSLSELHKWISQHWDPLISSIVHIYSMVKGFFVAKFENAKDRRKILCEIFFYEKDDMPLLAKPWHSDFNPLSKKFNKIPVWVRLPYLPIHLWAASLFEEIGDAIGNFIMLDNESFELYHTTCVRILVELDVFKGLPAEIVINSSFGSWVQSLDYEGIPFRCHRCFTTGHATKNCGLEKKNPVASQWSRASYQHYTIIKKSLYSSIESQVAGVSTMASLDSLMAKKDSSNAIKDVSVIKDVVIQDVVVSSTENGLMSLTPSAASLCVDTTISPSAGCGLVSTMVLG
ncbi:uncharacterized protein LOC131859220 [Cryptomeria japonica]|uniref:uncharacterized protein LOC131859220 n=1 Tax=Cryptomeria japonica TaxID=3369 RepID=UPI0027DAAA77|nr:uncharacterized protein LOC131859220 [Cryptomeria japonica]